MPRALRPTVSRTRWAPAEVSLIRTEQLDLRHLDPHRLDRGLAPGFGFVPHLVLDLAQLVLLPRLISLLVGPLLAALALCLALLHQPLHLGVALDVGFLRFRESVLGSGGGGLLAPRSHRLRGGRGCRDGGGRSS